MIPPILRMRKLTHRGTSLLTQGHRVGTWQGFRCKLVPDFQATLCMPFSLGRFFSPPQTAPPRGTQVYLNILASVWVCSQGSTHASVKTFYSSLCVLHNLSDWIPLKLSPSAFSSPSSFLFYPHHKLRSRPDAQLWLGRDTLLLIL